MFICRHKTQTKSNNNNIQNYEKKKFKKIYRLILQSALTWSALHLFFFVIHSFRKRFKREKSRVHCMSIENWAYSELVNVHVNLSNDFQRLYFYNILYYNMLLLKQASSYYIHRAEHSMPEIGFMFVVTNVLFSSIILIDEVLLFKKTWMGHS